MSTSQTATPTPTAPATPHVADEHQQNAEHEQDDDALLDRLKAIRERLLSLRKAPSGTKEMTRLWKEVSGIVVTLSQRREAFAPESQDALVEDIIPMFLQFWSLKGNQAENMYPVYVKLAKYKHTMEELLETGLFSKAILKDLDHHIHAAKTAVEGFKSTEVRNSMSRVSATKRPSASTRGSESSPSRLGPGLRLLESKLASCITLHKELKEALDIISPFLLPIHARLVEIKHDLSQLISRRSAHAFSLGEVQMLQDELLEIDSARIDGSYLGKDGTVLPGQATVIWLLEQCYEDAHELLALREAIGGENPLRPVYETLLRLKTKLDHLQLAIKYTFKCDDLIPIQMELGKIDNMRFDGKFVGENGVIPEGQAVLHFLLHKCYRMVYKIQAMTEPVGESVMPVYNELMTLRKCFLELIRWKVKLSARDLTMYGVKLSMLDSKRVDGKFIAEDGSIPEGQGILHDLLDECYNLRNELQETAEEDDSDDFGDFSEDDVDDYNNSEDEHFEVK
ncbi:hypothetical protein HDU98_011429 [Podochytrium sp. JEL0797]|nr:hypothetical protein HDU98_011429 [Podochytrium sp. JEL0797]